MNKQKATLVPAGGKVSGVVAAVLEFPSQGSVLESVNTLSSHVPLGETVVPPESVLAALLVPLSECEELTVVTKVGSRVRLGLNVGATEREITEEVGFEVLFSSLIDSVVDVLINLVISKEGETTNTKKKEKKETFYEEREAQKLRHKVVSINKCLASSQTTIFTCSSIVGTDVY